MNLKHCLSSLLIMSSPLMASNSNSRGFEAGFAKQSLVPPPEVYGDKPIYLAGFDRDRKSQGVHDPIEAIASVVSDGHKTIGWVALDLIGFMDKEVAKLQKAVQEAINLDAVIVVSTHNHQAPDTQGLWGKKTWTGGIHKPYLTYVRQQATKALIEAYQKREPARVLHHTIISPHIDAMVTDTRMPQVKDTALRVVQFRSSANETLGHWVIWGNHVETVWRQNNLITADYAGFLRRGIDKGLYHNNQLSVRGLGGITVFMPGNVGGLMTTNEVTPVPDPFSSKVFIKPSFAKAKAQGQILAQAVIEASRANKFTPLAPHARIQYQNQAISAPLDNWGFLVLSWIGTLDRDFSWQDGWFHIQSEVGLLQLGDISLAMVPGELYPEIAVGGITQMPGADYQTPPRLLPPLHAKMPGKLKAVINLTNDSIGYLIPYSEWDNKAPWLHNVEEETYGEVVSAGPEVGAAVHRGIINLLKESQPHDPTTH